MQTEADLYPQNYIKINQADLTDNLTPNNVLILDASDEVVAITAENITATQSTLKPPNDAEGFGQYVS